MAITSFAVSRDASTGNVLNCSLSFREIRVVNREEEEILASPADDVNGAPKDEGQGSTGETTKKTKEKVTSTLGSLTASLFQNSGR